MVVSSSRGASASTTCQPQLPSRQCSPQISHSGSPSLWVSWTKTTLIPDSRARLSRLRIAGTVASALGTTSVPGSTTKSFCMSPINKTVRLGSTRMPSRTSYFGTSTMRAISASSIRSAPYLVYRGKPPAWRHADKLLAPAQHGHQLADHEGGKDHEGAEDLDRNESVTREPVAEEGGEDGLHGQDDGGPRGRDVLLHRGLHQEGSGGGQKSRDEQRDPHCRRRQSDGIEERPHEDEEQGHGEDLGERQDARVVGGRVTGEERDVQPERRRAK